MQKIIVKIPKIIYIEKEIVVDHVRVALSSADLDGLRCTACGKKIGKKRPIFLVRASVGKPYRVCFSCGNHLEETKEK